MPKNCFYQAFKKTIPVFFGYIPIGIAFGLMVIEANYQWWLAPLMSIIMFTGAGQYLAIGLFASGTPLSAILITEFLVGIRHIFYGLSLIDKFRDCGKWKALLIFLLSDETYSIQVASDVPKDCNAGSFYGTIALLDYSYWILGTIIGAVLGSIIPFDFAGIDFALTALFTVILIDQIQKSKDFIPSFTGALTTLLAILLWKFGFLPNTNNILLIGLSLGITLIFFIKKGNLKCQ